LNIHGVNYVRQIEMRTSESLVLKPSAFEVGLAIEKLERYKSPDTDHIPKECLKHGVEQFALRSTNLLFLFGIRRNFLRGGRN
jgi:hypothetical protein